MSNQADNQSQPGRILSHDAGLGTVTEDMVENRAREIALTDGRSEPNDLDRISAREDLLSVEGDMELPPELDSPEIGNITEWDTPSTSTGSKAPDVYGDEESSISDTLVREGLDEADHDQRLNSALENPPDDEDEDK